MSVLVGCGADARRFDDNVVYNTWKKKKKSNCSWTGCGGHGTMIGGVYLPPVTKKYDNNTNENIDIADGLWNHVGRLIFMFGTSNTVNGRENTNSMARGAETQVHDNLVKMRMSLFARDVNTRR